MALSEQEIQWVNWVAGKEIDAKAQDAAIAHSKARDTFLTEIMSQQLAALTDEINAAQQLVIQREEDPRFLKAVYRKLAGSDKKDVSEMKWRAEDADTNTGILSKYELRADVEVDTVADIDEKVKNIPIEDLMKLNQSFDRIKQIEASMKMQLDDNGQPLFSNDDIRNELWTPLVRSGMIPDNMVPDEYSEHAVSFAGAQKFYGDKIEAYTATHTKAQENWSKGLRITKDVATLAGALTSGAITMANAGSVAENKQAITAKTKEMDNLPPGDTQKKAELAEQIKALKAENTAMANMSQYADTGSAILLGGISGAELAVEHHYSKEPDTLKKWMDTLQKGVAIAQSVSVSAATTGLKAQGATGGMVDCVTFAMNAAFGGAKLGPSLVLTLKEPNDDKRAGMIAGLVSDFAGLVADSINAVGGKIADLSADEKNLPPNDRDRIKQERANVQAAMKQIAAALKVGIVQAGNAPAIIRAYKNGDTKSLGLLLGGGAVAAAFSASSEKIFDEMRTDSSKAEMLDSSLHEALYKEQTGAAMEAGQDSGSATSMGKIGASVASLDKTVFAGLKPGLLDKIEAGALAETIQADVEKAQQKIADERLAAVFSPEGIQAIMDDVDAQLVGFEQLYSDARPDPDIESRTPEEINQALAAIDRAMANTAELRQKVAIINGVTAGAAGVLAALVPGTGAVVAAQKVAADIYSLIKCVSVHNAWVDSMEVAFAGQSGAAAAIQNTLKNAKIHLSQASVKLVLDSVKAGAEVARVFDPSGIATATSAGVSMAGAVVEFGYKMQKEEDIRRGWNAYKAALENPGNRKAARKALRLNSTLAKCAIAYGASIQGDPTAKQAIRATGLTVAALQNDKDICVKLIAYLENELADDPKVLKVDYKGNSNWHPGTPSFDLVSWSAFKAAARKAAQPRMAAESMASPAVDRLFAVLNKHAHWPLDATAFNAAKADADKLNALAADKLDEDEADAFRPLKDAAEQSVTDMATRLTEVSGYLERMREALEAYAPVTDETSARPHDEMIQIAKTFATLAKAERATVDARIADLALPKQGKA